MDHTGTYNCSCCLFFLLAGDQESKRKELGDKTRLCETVKGVL